MNQQWVVLKVKHNMEVAHRLYLLPGKCQNIHGHGMQVTLELIAPMDANGYALDADGTVLEFGAIKKKFRAFIDRLFDHHLHLNENDPFAQPLQNLKGTLPGMEMLPGLVTWPSDPSTENFAKWIFEAMHRDIGSVVSRVLIDETGTNGVEFAG